jgi:hypothetical protein
MQTRNTASKLAAIFRPRRYRTRRIATVNQALEAHWNLGQYVILAWSFDHDAILILRAPFASLSHFIDLRSSNGRSMSHIKPDEFLSSVLSGSRLMSRHEIAWIAKTLNAEVCKIPFHNTGSLTALETEQIDIVDFSLVDPIKQITLINSISLSLNWAEQQLRTLGARAIIARSSTGDGFYVWNRDEGPNSIRDLYSLLNLTLTNNALQAAVDDLGSVPKLKVAFHIGNYCDLYQCNHLRPDNDSIIVGNVTVELARILSAAQPGQILMGDFLLTSQVHTPSPRDTTDTVGFIAKHQEFLDQIAPFKVDGHNVLGVRCYLTGSAGRRGQYNVSLYRVSDKHGKQRDVFNAKLNIHLDSGAVIPLGIQDSEVRLYKAGRVST